MPWLLMPWHFHVVSNQGMDYLREMDPCLLRVISTIRAIHYSDVIIGAMASPITSFTIAYSTFYSGTDQRKHQSSVSLTSVRGIHRWPLNSRFKGPVTRKMYPFDDVIMFRVQIWSKIESIILLHLGGIAYELRNSELANWWLSKRCLNIKMPSYQYCNSHRLTALLSLYLQWKSLHLDIEMALSFRMGFC